MQFQNKNYDSVWKVNFQYWTILFDNNTKFDFLQRLTFFLLNSLGVENYNSNNKKIEQKN